MSLSRTKSCLSRNASKIVGPSTATGIQSVPVSCIKRRGATSAVKRTVFSSDALDVEADEKSDDSESEADSSEPDVGVFNTPVTDLDTDSKTAAAQEAYNLSMGAVAQPDLTKEDTQSCITKLKAFVKSLRVHGQLVDILGGSKDPESLLAHLNDVHSHLNQLLQDKMEL